LKKVKSFVLDEVKMKTPKKDTPIETPGEAPKNSQQEAENNAAESPAGELRAPVWSVVSFEKHEAGSITYAEAEQKIKELEAQKVSGLCIVTDEVAARMSVKNQPLKL
jgi:hypothetical protein